jgi:hypothetical protein
MGAAGTVVSRTAQTPTARFPAKSSRVFATSKGVLGMPPVGLKDSQWRQFMGFNANLTRTRRIVSYFPRSSRPGCAVDLGRFLCTRRYVSGKAADICTSARYGQNGLGCGFHWYCII